MNLIITILLAVVVLGVVAFDFQHKRIPNAVTISLLLGFLVSNWPGRPETWLGCWLLWLGWRMGWMGGGDAKLWMALLWAAPTHSANFALAVMVVSFFSTGLGQMLWRKRQNSPQYGVQSPGAWRTIPYLVWLIAAPV